MTDTVGTRGPSLLCVVGFPANTGFAWDFLEGLYARMADVLAGRGVRTHVAYPEVGAPPATLDGSTASFVELDASLGDDTSLEATRSFVAANDVRAIFLIDQPAYNRRYAAIRNAGVRRVVVYDHTSGSRTIPSGVKRVAKRLLRRNREHMADEILTVSDYVGRRQVEVALLPPEIIHTVHNGLEVPPKDPAAAGRLRELLGLDPARTVIGAASRAAPEKGIDNLLRAYDKACDTWDPPVPALVFFGDGPALEGLRTLAGGLRHHEHVHLPGYSPGADALLEGADVCVVPSVWEDALPLSVLGSMARGNLVIGTRVGGIPEMIEDGVSGLLVPAADVSALAEALRAAISDPELRARLGSAARERVALHFRPEDQIRRMVASVESAFD
ncbi:MAG: glycosyltransferase family 4 protein [Gemmatimonadota bacterium]|nr:glycosyltransferase family 4 protein [Gemmatimonadota bacterium]